MTTVEIKWEPRLNFQAFFTSSGILIGNDNPEQNKQSLHYYCFFYSEYDRCYTPVLESVIEYAAASGYYRSMVGVVTGENLSVSKQLKEDQLHIVKPNLNLYRSSQPNYGNVVESKNGILKINEMPGVLVGSEVYVRRNIAVKSYAKEFNIEELREVQKNKYSPKVEEKRKKVIVCLKAVVVHTDNDFVYASLLPSSTLLKYTIFKNRYSVKRGSNVSRNKRLHYEWFVRKATPLGARVYVDESWRNFNRFNLRDYLSESLEDFFIYTFRNQLILGTSSIGDVSGSYLSISNLYRDSAKLIFKKSHGMNWSDLTQFFSFNLTKSAVISDLYLDVMNFRLYHNMVIRYTKNWGEISTWSQREIYNEVKYNLFFDVSLMDTCDGCLDFEFAVKNKRYSNSRYSSDLFNYFDLGISVKQSSKELFEKERKTQEKILRGLGKPVKQRKNRRKPVNSYRKARFSSFFYGPIVKPLFEDIFSYNGAVIDDFIFDYDLFFDKYSFLMNQNESSIGGDNLFKVLILIIKGFFVCTRNRRLYRDNTSERPGYFNWLRYILPASSRCNDQFYRSVFFSGYRYVKESIMEGYLGCLRMQGKFCWKDTCNDDIFFLEHTDFSLFKTSNRFRLQTADEFFNWFFLQSFFSIKEELRVALWFSSLTDHFVDYHVNNATRRHAYIQNTWLDVMDDPETRNTVFTRVQMNSEIPSPEFDDKLFSDNIFDKAFFTEVEFDYMYSDRYKEAEVILFGLEANFENSHKQIYQDQSRRIISDGDNDDKFKLPVGESLDKPDSPFFELGDDSPCRYGDDFYEIEKVYPYFDIVVLKAPRFLRRHYVGEVLKLVIKPDFSIKSDMKVEVEEAHLVIMSIEVGLSRAYKFRHSWGILGSSSSNHYFLYTVPLARYGFFNRHDPILHSILIEGVGAMRKSTRFVNNVYAERLPRFDEPSLLLLDKNKWCAKPLGWRLSLKAFSNLYVHNCSNLNMFKVSGGHANNQGIDDNLLKELRVWLETNFSKEARSKWLLRDDLKLKSVEEVRKERERMVALRNKDVSIVEKDTFRLSDLEEFFLKYRPYGRIGNRVLFLKKWVSAKGFKVDLTSKNKKRKK